MSFGATPPGDTGVEKESSDGRTLPAPTLPAAAWSSGEAKRPLFPVGCNVLLSSFLAFVLIVFGVWVVSAGKTYREEYANAMDGWRVGSTKTVELTLVKEDKRNLGCASDQVIAGLRCGHGQDLREVNGASPDSPHILQPYNTVGSELLFGAALWLSPDLKTSVPNARFTAKCSYQIKGMMRSSSIRFSSSAAFGQVGKLVPAGILSDCTIAR